MSKFPHPIGDTQQMLAWRGIEDPCPTCRGCGVRVYVSTATWMGGMGCAAMTPGVCDTCWGSGDVSRKWTDLRTLRDSENARIRRGVEEWLANHLGVTFEQQRELVRRIADVVEKESRRRNVKFWWARACEHFAETLRELAKDPEISEHERAVQVRAAHGALCSCKVDPETCLLHVGAP